MKKWKKLTLLAAALTTLNGCSVELQPNDLPGTIIPPGKSISTNHDNEYTEEIPLSQKITISFAGDCTIGSDTNFRYNGSFHDVFNKEGSYDYFFEKVKPIFENDDYTIVNFEGALTESKVKNHKSFNFKGPEEYANILTAGSIEGVNIANNHSYDYKEAGYLDTKKTLKEAAVDYFGYNRNDNENETLIKDVNGITLGMLGFNIITSSPPSRQDVKEQIDYLKNQFVDIIIVTFHWGVERDYTANDNQKSLAHFAIDNGADLIIGHHPHVLQGIEEYKDKYIVYSLGNFCFGGNRNPSDKDSMIFQQTFEVYDGEIVDSSYKIIPCSISGKTSVNNYRPTPLEGKEKERVLKKILKDSNIAQ